jgi:alpha-ketoglutarate-dependent taurine dioxygenase
MLNHTALTPDLGRLIEGLDVSQPLSDAVIAELRRLLHTHGLLLFRDQVLTDAQQARLAQYFGRFSRQGPVQKTSQDVTYVSNTRADGTFGKGELLFHSDQCYYPHPMKAIMLYGVEVASKGGHTLYTNTSRVLERLSSATVQTLQSCQVRHQFHYGDVDYGQGVDAKVEKITVSHTHPAIAHHPWSDQRIVMISQATATELTGLAQERSRELIDEVNRALADPAHLYEHHWRKNDLVIWDNLLLQHARPDFDPNERRTLRRCALAHELEPTAAP